MVPKLLVIFLLVPCSIVYAQYFEISSDRSSYGITDEIILDVWSNDTFSDEYTVWIIDPRDENVQKYTVPSGNTELIIKVSDIYEGDGRYIATISHLDASLDTSFDIVRSPPKEMPPQDIVVESDVNDDVDLDAVSEFLILDVEMVITLFVFMVSLIFIGCVAGYYGTKSRRKAKPRTSTQNYVEPKIRENKFDFNYRAKIENERLEPKREYDTEKLPDSGHIIPDTNILYDHLDGKMYLNPLYYRLVILDAVDSEFKNKNDILWYKNLKIQPAKMNDMYKEKLHAIYDEKGPEFRKWCEKKLKNTIREKCGVVQPSLDDLIKIAESSEEYQRLKNDITILVKAITFAEANGNSCLLTKDVDILVYARKIKELSGGKLVVVSGYDLDTA